MTAEQLKLSDYKIDVVSVRLVKDREYFSKTPIHTADDAVQTVGQALRDWDREAILIFNLDTKNRVINMNVASIGTINCSVTCMRELVKSAVLSNAAQIIMMHNHPSGDISPSPEDIDLTKRLVSVGELMGIPLIDHIIVGGDDSLNYFSFSEHDYLKPAETVFQIVDDTKKKRKTAKEPDGKPKKRRRAL